MVLAAVAALLAARSTPDRPDALAPTTSSPAPRPDAPPVVLSVAVGRRAAYALVATCGTQIVHECSYRVQRRDLGGDRWLPLPLLTQRRTTTGLAAQLHVTGEDTVTVVDEQTRTRAYVSVGGGTPAVRSLQPGPPIAQLAADDILGQDLCAECPGLTVLEPGTGLLRPLATQPPLGGTQVRSFDVSGRVVWAVGTTRDAVVSAVSRDGGRSWQAVPVRGLALPLESVRVVVARDGGAHLVGGRDGPADVLNKFTELWQVDGGVAAGWRRVTPATRPTSVLALLAGARGLLISEESGTLWRLRPNGALRRLPDPVVDGTPVPPGLPATGPAGVLVTLPYAQDARGTLLVSFDEGETWRVEQLAR